MRISLRARGPLAVASVMLALAMEATPATSGPLPPPASPAPLPRQIITFPSVVSAAGSAPAMVEIKTEVDATSVVLDLAAGGSVPFTATDPRTFSAVLTHAQLLHDYAPDDVNRNFVGFLHVTPVAPMPDGTFNLFVNVEDAAIPDVSVTTPALDLRCAPHVVNLNLPATDVAELWEPPYGDEDAVLSRFYEVFGDDYDFANVVFLGPSVRENRDHFGVRNDVLGIGLSSFDNTSVYGSAGRLRGITRFPISTFFDLGGRSAQHELGHQWINYLTTVPHLGAGSPHWPPSDLARGVMGFNIPGTNVGGSFPWSLTPDGGGTFTLDSAPAQKVYSPLDLYLMGFIDAADVPAFAVMDPPDQPLVPATTVTGVTMGVGEVVSSVGPRLPDASTAPKHFTMATLVVTRTGPLTDREMAFFDHFAARAEATTLLPYGEGFEKGIDAHPFALATQGLGSLDASVACPKPEAVPLPPFPTWPCKACPPMPCLSCRTCSAGSTC